MKAHQKVKKALNWSGVYLHMGQGDLALSRASGASTGANGERNENL